MRDNLWLVSATAWLSPDGTTQQWSTNSELVGYLSQNARRIAARLPVQDLDQVEQVWSLGDLFGDDLQRRLRSRQKQVARLKETVQNSTQRVLAR